MKIEVTYNKKSTALITDPLQVSFVNAARDATLKSLKPFVMAIFENDGEVIVDIERTYTGTILKSKNLPKELVKEMKLAIKSILN